MEILLTLAAVIVAAAVFAVRWWVWNPVVKRRLVVQLVDGTSIEGVCITRRGPLMVLDDVTVRSGGSAVAADGRTVVDRSRVLWMQVIS